MGAKVEYKPGRGFVGITGSRPFTVPGADHFGEVQAWNVDTGAEGLDAQLREIPQLGFDDGVRRRTGVQ